MDPELQKLIADARRRHHVADAHLVTNNSLASIAESLLLFGQVLIAVLEKDAKDEAALNLPLQPSIGFQPQQ